MNTNKRTYNLKKRAEQQDETRQRIIEAAVELHEQLGPAETSISAIAERAGVGRPTVYRHFPDERSLFTACTSHYLAQHLPPDPADWVAVEDPEERLRLGLRQTYRWYRETEGMMTVAFRDLPELPVLEEVMAPMLAGFSKAHSVLVDAWAGAGSELLHAAIGHAMAFSTWQSLARDYGLPDEIVADLLTEFVVTAVSMQVATAA